jgi:excisionase family DNA binding protein
VAKRLRLHPIRAARTYTIEEVAEALGVSIGTVRAWAKAGLPIMKSERPYLILGEQLREFLQDRSVTAKVHLKPDQLYCFTCKAPRTPYGMLADLIPQTSKTARLVGLCDACGGTCNRMISRSSIDRLGQIFDLRMREGRTA